MCMWRFNVSALIIFIVYEGQSWNIVYEGKIIKISH